MRKKSLHKIQGKKLHIYCVKSNAIILRDNNRQIQKDVKQNFPFFGLELLVKNPDISSF